jgi:two-component system nitrate/nitrite response regulator NarL
MPNTRDRSLLTNRENDVVELLVTGDSNKEIARKLGVSETTIKVHVTMILRKLHLKNRVQLAVWGVKRGYESG